MEQASLMYYVITRKIELAQQCIVEEEKKMVVYEDKIVADNRSFSLNAVLDISFKSTLNEYDILYLHTNSGIFSFLIKDNPKEFIQMVKAKES